MHQVGLLEWRKERKQLVDDAANGPDVTLVRVGTILPYLWAQVHRAPIFVGARFVWTLEHLAAAQVAQLDDARLGDEHIRRLSAHGRITRAPEASASGRRT